MGLSSEEARQLNSIVDEKDNVVLSKLLNWDISATVVSVGNGSAVVHLPTDPSGTNLTVQNPNEISLEVGDQVTIHKTNGNINNAIVLFRKTVNFNDIYVDYNTGTDAFGRDTSGNLYGSEDAPFKTLQYAVNRLPKNLNGRAVNIYFNNLNENGVFIDKFYGGRFIDIQPLDGSTVQTIPYIVIYDCMAGINIYYLKFNGKNDVYNLAAYAFNDFYVSFYNCDASIAVSDGSSGFGAAYGTNMSLTNCNVSNRNYAIYGTRVSNIYSSNNTGSGNSCGLAAYYNSTIGKTGTQPTGATAESAVGGSVIR